MSMGMGLTAALVVLPGLGDLVVPWPGGQLHFINRTRVMLRVKAWQPPSTTSCSCLHGSHTISGRRLWGCVLLFSHHCPNIYLREGNQNSPHSMPFSLPTKRTQGRNSIHTSGKCNLVALVQHEKRHVSALQIQQCCCLLHSYLLCVKLTAWALDLCMCQDLLGLVLAWLRFCFSFFFYNSNYPASRCYYLICLIFSLALYDCMV